jgi:hypothetical protein
MDLGTLFKSVGDAVSGHLLLIALAALAVIVSIFIMCDAHRCKKKRARHRWK